MYKELAGVVDNPADTFYYSLAEAAYFYDGSNWWTGESAQSIKADIDFMQPSSCTTPSPSASAPDVPGDDVSFNATNCTSTRWSTDIQPGSAIAWNIWKPDGACAG